MKEVSLVSETNSLAVVIEHIEPSSRKINYINSLFSYIECDIKTISKVNFNGNNPKQPNALRVNVKYITTFHQCIYYGSNKHFGYNYFIYAIYVLILYIL